MRDAPPEVAPVVHRGIVYEAPHWGSVLPLQPGETADDLDEATWVTQTLVAAMAREPSRTDLSSDWIRSTLEEAGHDAETIERTVERSVVQQALHQALMTLATSTISSIRHGSDPQFDSGDPLGCVTEEKLRPLLEQKGLDAGQVRKALNLLERQKGIESAPSDYPQNGGYILAREEESGKPLWCLQVYRTSYDDAWERDGQETFITKLEAEGNCLLVTDEKGRTHSVNLKTREIEENSN